ncbi:MAG: hypothetical protein WDN75_08850 [Bacteroidota bacterium]
MFEDLTRKDILKAIESLLTKGYERETPYRVWYQNDLIPPKEIIRQAYHLKSVINPNDNFHTDQAQERLLALGFPIAESGESTEDQFFSEKDMVSFSKLASRASYDSADTVDQNIAAYLYAVPWGKTQTWANGLKAKGWIVKGHRNWNIQDRIHGQSFKRYTWFRIFPSNFQNDLIFFTVGINLEGELVLKLDIYRDDKSFPNDLIDHFDTRREQLGAIRRIAANELTNYSWDRLIKKTDQFFRDQLENYFALTKKLWPDERLMRLTWNRNNWEFPSGHKWNIKSQGTNEAHERQYGYGHEEWLFNSRYRINGFQYGYIRGINQMGSDEETVDKLLLFTIDPVSKNRYLVGRLNDVEIIERYEPEQVIITPVVTFHLSQMAEELSNVGADVSHFRQVGFVANVRFSWAAAEIFNTPILFNQIKGRQYNRFQPYKIDAPLQKAIDGELRAKAKLTFQPGKAASSPSYEKSSEAKKTTVQRRHGTITDDLYEFHLLYRGFSPEQLSCEKTRVGGQIVDFAINANQSFSLFEVKTASVGLRNVRLAIGQLLEYALLDQTTIIDKLAIVGPADLNKDELEYFRRIQSTIKLKLEYWSYSFDESMLEKKFKIIT